MKYSVTSILPLLFASLFLLNLAGCGSVLQYGSSDAGEDLATRVDRLMQAKIEGDWAEVYSFYDSGYKESISRKEFLNLNRSMDFLDYSVSEIEKKPSGDAAKVTVKVDFSSYGFDLQFPDVQHWIKENGTWYQKLEKREKML